MADKMADKADNPNKSKAPSGSYGARQDYRFKQIVPSKGNSGAAGKSTTAKTF